MNQIEYYHCIAISLPKRNVSILLSISELTSHQDKINNLAAIDITDWQTGVCSTLMKFKKRNSSPSQLSEIGSTLSIGWLLRRLLSDSADC